MTPNAQHASDVMTTDTISVRLGLQTIRSCLGGFPSSTPDAQVAGVVSIGHLTVAQDPSSVLADIAAPPHVEDHKFISR